MSAPVTVDELVHVLDNSTPYPVELDRDVLHYMARQVLAMTEVTRRGDHDIWRPDQDAVDAARQETLPMA